MSAATRQLYMALCALLRVVLATAPPPTMDRACRSVLAEAERLMNCHNRTVA